MDDLLRDITFACRMLAKSPVFAVSALLVLGLTIGTDTVVFAAFNAMLLRPLPAPHSERVVAIREVIKDGTADALGWQNVAPANFADWRSRGESFERLGVFETLHSANLTGVDEPARLTVVNVSPAFFLALAVQPKLGRVPSDMEAHRGRFVVLSDRVWRRHFNSDKGIEGKQVMLDGRPYTVVGVMPASFDFPLATDIWLGDDLEYEPLLVDRHLHSFGVVARLKPGLSVNSARTEMNAVAAQLEQEYPATNAGHGIEIQPLLEALVPGAHKNLLLLAAAAGLLLLIACANIANLLLAQSLKRHKELAARQALGATRGRLIRQLLTESLLLGLFGGILGTLLALVTTLVLQEPISRYVAQGINLRVDVKALTFTTAVSVLTAILFGILPAFYCTRFQPIAELADGSQPYLPESRHYRTTGLIVILELGITCVLLTGAGLLVGSLVELLRTNPGYKEKGLLYMQVSPSITKYRKPADRQLFKEQLAKQLAAVPGVESVGIADGTPDAVEPIPIAIEGAAPGSGPEPTASVSSVTPGYFKTMQIPILLGRDFSDDDRADSTPVAIVSQALATRFLGDRNPLGAGILVRLAVGGARPPMCKIVGVVADVRDLRLGSRPIPWIYRPDTQEPSAGVAAFVRTSVQGAAQVQGLRLAARSIDPDVPVEVKTMESYLLESAGWSYFGALLLGAFACISLAISAIGVYGVISYSTASRKGEFAIKIALGAEPATVLKEALRQGLILGLAGTGVGIIASLKVAPILRSFLYEIRPSEPVVLGAMWGLLFSVSLLASIIPAYDVLKIDPAAELRCH